MLGREWEWEYVIGLERSVGEGVTGKEWEWMWEWKREYVMRQESSNGEGVGVGECEWENGKEREL